MLQRLYLKNFVLIDEVELNFTNGFSVFIGETGAGKSLIVDALQFIAGQRTNTQVIKKGKEKTIIEATFSIDSTVQQAIQQLGIAVEDELVISKEIMFDKTVTKLNYRSITNTLLKQIAPLLMDIHEQHALQKFLDEKSHLTLLDEYGQIDQSDYENDYENYVALKNKKLQLENDESLDVDYLSFQLQEIERIDPKQDEDIHLKKQVDTYIFIQKQKQQIGQALARVEIEGVLALGQIYQDQECIDMYYALEEKIQDYSKRLEQFDDEDIDSIQERLFSIQALKKKYGGTLDKVLEKKAQLQQRIFELEDKNNLLEKIEVQLKQVEKRCIEQAMLLTTKRKEKARALEKALIDAMRDLNFNYIAFKIAFFDVSLSRTGKDAIQLLISFNKGEDLKPIIDVASGGELSRVLLALKAVLSQYQVANTFIFDEIDSGVSGKVALAIGKKMHTIGKHKQVICISHLAAVSACADTVYGVAKTFDDDTTTSYVTILEGDALIKELALLASSHHSEIAIESAKDLISLAKRELDHE